MKVRMLADAWGCFDDAAQDSIFCRKGEVLDLPLSLASVWLGCGIAEAADVPVEEKLMAPAENKMVVPIKTKRRR